MIHQPETFCVYFIDLFVTQNNLIPGTLVNRIVDMGISAASLILTGCTNSNQSSYTADGLINSLRFMLYNDNYIKPWSNEYLLFKHLTKSSLKLLLYLACIVLVYIMLYVLFILLSCIFYGS